MKKSAKVLAVLMVGALFVGSVSAYAAGAAEGAGRYKRAAISESENGSKAGFKKFGKMRKPAAFERAELTEEEKAAREQTMKENWKKALDERLAAGKITQEKYDQAIAKLEAGEFKFFGNGLRGPKNEMPEKGEFRGKGFRGKNGKPAELTEEEKAARAQTMKENWKKALDERLAAGKITQEKYDQAIAKLEAGEFKFTGMGFKGGRWGRPNKTASEQTK